jgi:hypothetical protein
MDKVNYQLFEWIWCCQNREFSNKSKRLKDLIIKNTNNYTKEMVNYIIIKKDLETLKKIYNKASYLFTEIDLTEIIKYGDVEILEWIYKENKYIKIINKKYGLIWAVKMKNLDILEWIWSEVRIQIYTKCSKLRFQFRIFFKWLRNGGSC